MQVMGYITYANQINEMTYFDVDLCIHEDREAPQDMWDPSYLYIQFTNLWILIKLSYYRALGSKCQLSR